MNLNDGLVESLKQYLPLNKSRLSCLCGMLLSLLRLKQVNLTQLALAFSSEASPQSRYRRLQRFFAEVVFNYDHIAHLIMSLFDFESEGYYLALDRTNWQWGKTDINFLTLAVVYQGVAIPVYWLVLNKKGNSNQRERICLIHRFIQQFGRNNIKGIIADREFIGGEWWSWLTENEIPFFIRIKQNQCLNEPQKQQPLSHFFRDLTVGQLRCLRKPRLVGQTPVYLSALRLETGELLIVASNIACAKLLDIYALRWQIEHLFQCLKGRGFHFEEMHLTHYFRIKKMMALLAIALAWAHKVGEWQHKVIKPLVIKKHGRLEKSYFRYGLDYLTDCLLHHQADTTLSLHLLSLFTLTPNEIMKNHKIANTS
jgi:hypothetical protein